MIEVTPAITLQDDEIELDFIQASGLGGQNVNGVWEMPLPNGLHKGMRSKLQRLKIFRNTGIYCRFHIAILVNRGII